MAANPNPTEGALFRMLLTDEELQVPAIDDLSNKFIEWLALTKEKKGGRKTRSANKKADNLYEEILNYRIPRIEVKEKPIAITTTITATTTSSSTATTSHSGSSTAYNSMGSDEDCSNRPITRSLRSRSKAVTSPTTPTHQRIRAYIKQPPSGGGNSNVLSAALNQQHPSVSVTKIRQLLRADSAQKKRDEERERHERLMLDRKAKEERAEAQKRQILEERAINAKLKREERLKNAAEVRLARQEAKMQERLREERAKKLAQTAAATATQQQQVDHHKIEPVKPETQPNLSKQATQKEPNPVPLKTDVLNGTFKKTKDGVDNIDIVIHDDTQEEEQTQIKNNVPQTATWARSPYLRDALVKQFSKTEAQRRNEVAKIFAPVELPVELKLVFGPKYAGTSRLVRTSSAVWTPPHKPVKRTSSMVMTPNNK